MKDSTSTAAIVLVSSLVGFFGVFLYTKDNSTGGRAETKVETKEPVAQRPQPQLQERAAQPQLQEPVAQPQRQEPVAQRTGDDHLAVRLEAAHEEIEGRLKAAREETERRKEDVHKAFDDLI